MLALSFGSPLVKIARSHIHYLGKKYSKHTKSKKYQNTKSVNPSKKEGWLFPVLDWIYTLDSQPEYGWIPGIPNLDNHPSIHQPQVGLVKKSDFSAFFLSVKYTQCYTRKQKCNLSFSDSVVFSCAARRRKVRKAIWRKLKRTFPTFPTSARPSCYLRFFLIARSSRPQHRPHGHHHHHHQHHHHHHRNYYHHRLSATSDILPNGSPSQKITGFIWNK